MTKAQAFICAALLAVAAAGCAADPTPGARSGVIAPQLTGEISGEITVSCYDSMLYQNYLEEAAKRFEQAYPGTAVRVETFSAVPEIKTVEQDGMTLSVIETNDDPQARTDYINRTGTALMSGGGADLLAMDVLPLYDYATAGQLVDLSGYIDADPLFNADDYHAQIFDAMRFADGLWCIPLDYQFRYFTYDTTLAPQELVRTLEAADGLTYAELLDLGGGMGTVHPLFFKRETSVLRELVGERYHEFVELENRTARFDDGRFAALLELVGECAEQDLIRRSARMDATAEELLSFAVGGDSEERALFRNQYSYYLLDFYTHDLVDLTFSFSSENGGGVETDDAIGAIQALADGGVPFTYDQGYAINANSGNKETAWAFLRFLLSEEMQTSTWLGGNLPMNNAARARMAEMTMSGEIYGEDAQPLDESMASALAAYNAIVEEMSARIDCFVLRDPVVDDIMEEEAAAFFAGEKSAAQAADDLQSRAQLYLNE